jgi:hypothetical protein
MSKSVQNLNDLCPVSAIQDFKKRDGIFLTIYGIHRSPVLGNFLIVILHNPNDIL